MAPGVSGAGAPDSRVSFWFDTLGAPPPARPALVGEHEADVAIVGAGYTGLWTAYYLSLLDPALRIVVLEREVAGFGASGRNGGWCSALFATSAGALVREHGREAADALRLALQDAVDEVGRATAAEGIDCHYAKGGTIVLARSPAQWERLRAEVAAARTLGIGEEDLALLGADEARAEIAASHVLGATFTPHCAAIQPARLVTGLAAAVERRGVRIYEHTAVRTVERGIASCPGGRVRAGMVVVATEGYGTDLPGFARRLAPVYSLMVASEPLSAAQWDEIGLAQRATFSDERHLIVYGQRTADGRIAFGGRGAPYHFGSAVRPDFDRDARVHAGLVETVREMLPALGDVGFTHHWGGALGVPRDWHPSVGIDHAAQLAWAGGYVGDGVGCTNLAGRTLAELLLGRTSARTGLCWVNHRSPDWEPEPLRYLGMNAGLLVMSSADRAEQRSGRPARRAAWFGRFLGG